MLFKWLLIFLIENSIGGDMALVSPENQKLYVPKKRYSEFELVRVETIYIIIEK